jgi:hypothetical protein
VIAAMAVSWLRRRGRELAAGGKPWFLAVNLVNPHDVMFFDTDPPGTEIQASHALTHVVRPPKDPLYAKQWDFELPRNHAQTLDAPERPPAHVDFLRSHELDAAGLTERTIVILTADHGDMDGAHQLHAKGAVSYREQNHVPLVLLHGPGFPDPRQGCTLPCRHHDSLRLRIPAIVITRSGHRDHRARSQSERSDADGHWRGVTSFRREGPCSTTRCAL